MISVCYVLSYYAPNYVRTRTLIKALKGTSNLKLYEARNSSKSILRYFETLWKLISIRLRHDPNYYILGFRGYELYWVVRLITWGRSLIYDHMMSPYDSLLNERKLIKGGGVLANFVYFYERSILQDSDLILTDTEFHKDFFQKTFDLPPSKILPVPVGADEDLFHAIESRKVSDNSEFFEVLFYGSFLPLHGIEIILKSASLLRKTPTHFTLIGGNKAYRAEINQMIKQLHIDNLLHKDWVDFESLPELISQSDIGLGGPFGNTGQAHRVITGKTFQFLAMAKPVIVGRIDGSCGFVDKVNCLIIPQGDEEALAEAITWGFHHRAELKQIGLEGYNLYHSHYSIKQISGKLKSCWSTLDS